MKDPKDVTPGGVGLLLRLYWLFLGNVLLLFLLVFIIEKRPGLPSLFDAAYFAALISLITVRYVDIRFLKGETGEGKPATMADWRTHALIVGPVGAGAWLLVRFIVHSLK
jgi:hypothetical protein